MCELPVSAHLSLQAIKLSASKTVIFTLRAEKYNVAGQCRSYFIITVSVRHNVSVYMCCVIFDICVQ